MSAETLRTAAAKMRERAEAAPSGAGWYEDGGVWVLHDPDGGSASAIYEGEPIWAEGVSAHVASWHPAVALAVADWLDEMASKWTFYDDLDAPLAVANAYLGT